MKDRYIFSKNEIGRRQVKEALCGILLGLTQKSDTIWIVSGWITDFILLDNTFNGWTNLNPSWVTGKIKFSDMIIFLAETGSDINLVLKDDEKSRDFIEKIKNNNRIKIIYKDSEHEKGLLTSNIWFLGSMNFTYWGLHKSDEGVTIINDPIRINKCFLEWNRHYQ